MLQNNVLVRKPIGIETAGSLNILFSDKTGTITKGELEVVEFFDGDLKDSYQSSNYIKEYMGLCIGKNTGAMAAKILKGEATAKDTEYIKTADSALYVNTEAADKIGMELDKDYIADAAETFTEITVE